MHTQLRNFSVHDVKLKVIILLHFRNGVYPSSCYTVGKWGVSGPSSKNLITVTWLVAMVTDFNSIIENRGFSHFRTFLKFRQMHIHSITRINAGKNGREYRIATGKYTGYQRNQGPWFLPTQVAPPGGQNRHTVDENPFIQGVKPHCYGIDSINCLDPNSEVCKL